MKPIITYPVTPVAHPCSITIIGHQGRMGSTFMHIWQQAGFTVTGVDRPDPSVNTNASCTAPQSDTHTIPTSACFNNEELARAVANADIVVLCVPVLVLESVVAEVAKHLTGKQLLIDVTSVKILPMQYMKKAYKGPIIGTHPLFGPMANLTDLHVAITPANTATALHYQQVESLFTCFGCHCFATTPEEHDTEIAYAQALNFVSNAAYFATVAQRPKIAEYVTPSLKRRIDAGKKQMTVDGNMFLGFTAANPMLGSAIQNMRKVLDLIEQGQLPQVVKQAQWWYRQDIE